MASSVCVSGGVQSPVAGIPLRQRDDGATRRFKAVYASLALDSCMSGQGDDGVPGKDGATGSPGERAQGRRSRGRGEGASRRP